MRKAKLTKRQLVRISYKFKRREREVERRSSFYSLEAIIAVGYRVNSERGTQFRQWATGILKNYIHKGYALDVNRMKYGSRFS